MKNHVRHFVFISFIFFLLMTPIIAAAFEGTYRGDMGGIVLSVTFSNDGKLSWRISDWAYYYYYFYEFDMPPVSGKGTYSFNQGRYEITLKGTWSGDIRALNDSNFHCTRLAGQTMPGFPLYVSEDMMDIYGTIYCSGSFYYKGRGSWSDDPGPYGVWLWRTSPLTSPDLIVSSMNWTPSAPKSADDITLEFTAKNQGDGASGACSYQVKVDNSIVSSGSLPSLAAKKQTTISGINLGKLSQGNHIITVIVDSNGAVNESDETNNALSRTIAVQAGWYNTKITGLIKDAQTLKPINGIIVQLDGGVLQTNTDAKGKFTIYEASTGNHKLQVWGFAYDFKQYDIYVYGNKDTQIDEILMTKLKGTVVGRMVDSQTGEPLAAAAAQLDGGGKWRTRTDEQGYFMFLSVTPGAHTLQAWSYAYNFQEQPITVNATGATDIGNRYFSIVPNTIRGQIVDAGTNRPIMNAHVQYDGGGVGKETKSNISGRFILVNVPAGVRQLQTWGWAYQFNQTAVAQNSGAATDAGKIGIRPIGGTVNGRLLDADNGLPVYNAFVQMDGGIYSPYLTTSLLNGDFIIYNVTGGTHLFQTWGYAYRFYQKSITATSGSNLNLGDILLTPDPNTFNGRALDAGTRLPISGATVILTGNGQNITTTSFPDGRFVLLNIPQGIYDITVEDATHNLVHIKAAHPGNNVNVDIGDAMLP
ncbi:MAG TPA: carboxypeptidase regulatory-like domain-containing protein [Candidatus Sumerlaeia bacterium]|nr:carboxypeptidase regulatory-like domain-containing protein [Candidatus Sumerlaeia bacterium]